MAQADRIYKLQFRKHFTNHEANFPPSRPIELGAYGVMENGYFKRYGNIKDTFGIAYTPIPDESPSYETFKSEGSVGVKVGAKGDIGAGGVPLLKAQIEFSFSSEKSLFFSSAGVKYIQMKSLDSVGERLVELYKQNKWKKKYVLVSSILEAGNTLILISGSAQCNVVVEAKSDKIKELDLADGSIEFGIKASSQVSYEILTPECQLGFSLSRVYNPLFVGPDFKFAKNRAQVFASLDHDKTADAKGLVFGNIIPGTYDA
jgi:hypothetical protein